MVQLENGWGDESGILAKEPYYLTAVNEFLCSQVCPYECILSFLFSER